MAPFTPQTWHLRYSQALEDYEKQFHHRPPLFYWVMPEEQFLPILEAALDKSELITFEQVCSAQGFEAPDRVIIIEMIAICQRISRKGVPQSSEQHQANAEYWRQLGRKSDHSLVKDICTRQALKFDGLLRMRRKRELDVLAGKT